MLQHKVKANEIEGVMYVPVLNFIRSTIEIFAPRAETSDSTKQTALPLPLNHIKFIID